MCQSVCPSFGRSWRSRLAVSSRVTLRPYVSTIMNVRQASEGGGVSDTKSLRPNKANCYTKHKSGGMMQSAHGEPAGKWFRETIRHRIYLRLRPEPRIAQGNVGNICQLFITISRDLLCCCGSRGGERLAISAKCHRAQRPSRLDEKPSFGARKNRHRSTICWLLRARKSRAVLLLVRSPRRVGGHPTRDGRACAT